MEIEVSILFTQVLGDVRFAESIEVVKSFCKSTGGRMINILQLCATCISNIVPL